MKRFRLAYNARLALRLHILENKKYVMCTINSARVVGKNIMVNATVLSKNCCEEIEVLIKRRKALRIVRKFLAIPKASSDYTIKYYPSTPMPIKTYGETETRLLECYR